MGGSHPPDPIPQHIKIQKCLEAPRQPRGLETQDPHPKTDFITPGPDSFPLHLQVPSKSPLPAFAGSVRHQMPSPRTPVGAESKEDNSRPQPIFSSKDPSRLQGPIPQPRGPRADGSFSWGGGWDMRNVPLLFGGRGASPGALQLPLPAALSDHNPVTTPSVFPPQHSPLLLISQSPSLITSNLPPQASAPLPRAPHLSRLSTNTCPSLPLAPGRLPLCSLPITSSPLGSHPPVKPGPPRCPPVWSPWPGPAPCLSTSLLSPLQPPLLFLGRPVPRWFLPCRPFRAQRAPHPLWTGTASSPWG